MFHIRIHFMYPFLAVIVIFMHKDMPKRKTNAFYSQLAKQRFASINSTHSHVDSLQVSLDANAHLDSP